MSAIVGAVRDGETTATAIVGEAFARIERSNPPLNAVVETFPDRALDRAAENLDGPLTGIPVVIKDAFGLPWRAPLEGAGKWPGTVDAVPSALYRALQRSGAVIVGIANMHQLGIGSTGHISAYGPCRNPWDLQRCPGGSSSGSAVAVAAGMVPAAIGTDGAGSIRIPAAYCGVVGLKPTFGAIPMDGYTGDYSTTSVIGPLSRDTADCRLMMEGLTGMSLKRSREPLRIGLMGGEVWEDVHEGVRSRCEEAIEALGSHGSVTRQVTIAGFEHALIASVNKLSVERLPNITPGWMSAMGDALHPTIRGILMARLLTSGNLIARIDRIRSLLRRELKRVFAEVHVLAWPTVPAPAPLIERPTVELPSGPISADVAAVRQNGLANLTGIPAISAPAGLADGLPVGLMFHAAWGREGILLEAAERLEEATDRAFVSLWPPASGA